MLLSLKHSAIAATLALGIATLPAAPALAWGDREKGFVAGIATAIIVDEILKDARKTKPHHAAPPPVAPKPVHVKPTYGSIHATPAARAFNTYSRAERQAIQRSLRSMGYYYGRIDGAFGPGTYDAVAAYARDAGAAGQLASAGGAFGVYDSLIY